LGKEGKEKRMMVNNIKILHIYADREHKDMYGNLSNNGGESRREGVKESNRGGRTDQN
jgi:hypothetical protein